MPAFKKDADFIYRTQNPINAGMPLTALIESQVTPTDRFFVRSHAPAPYIEPADYRLHVDGLVSSPLSLSLAELRNDFEHVTLEATLQCAGNRRRELMAVQSMGEQVPWGAEAVGNAVWGGVRLRDLLLAAGIAAGRDLHVAFTGLDEVTQAGHSFDFGGSIPVTKALSAEVLLATEMNGEALPLDHGAPLRVVVPGYIGARSVKWLGRITVQSEPSTNHFQTRAYKLFPPHVHAEGAVWSQGLMLGEYPVNAVICDPSAGATVPPGPVTVRGYALVGGDRTIERVDVSTDSGKSWQTADLHTPSNRWAWRLWQITLPLEPGSRELVVRAWDSAANTQPEDARKLWNFKGYLNNAWHRIQITVGSA